MFNDVIDKCENLSILCPTDIVVTDKDMTIVKSWMKFQVPYIISRYFDNYMKKLSTKHQENIASQQKETKKDSCFIYIFSDPFGFCSLNIPVEKENKFIGFLTYGPFITEKMSITEVKYIANRIKADNNDFELIKVFFKVVPYHEKETISKISGLFTDMIYGTKKKQIMIKHDISYELPSKDLYVDVSDTDHSFVYTNYRAEARFISAIEHGDVEYVRNLMKSGIRFFNLPPRYPSDPLREMKNLSITMNSISLRAAIRGGLEESRAHDMSHEYAVDIEKQTDAEGLGNLMVEIVTSYAKAVRRYSLTGYSDMIKNCMNHITRDISSNISLCELAQLLHVSKEHLSRQFKKEVKMNVTDYIHKEKIHESLDFLKLKRYGINEISEIFSYSSPSYYTKMFAKHMGMSPKKWLETQERY